MKRFWNWLLKVALRRSGRDILLVPENFGPVLAVAKKLTEEISTVPDVSGEWKLHQVYAAMIKVLPNVKKRVISLAIQVALNAGTDY